MSLGPAKKAYLMGSALRALPNLPILPGPGFYLPKSYREKLDLAEGVASKKRGKPKGRDKKGNKMRGGLRERQRSGASKQKRLPC